MFVEVNFPGFISQESDIISWSKKYQGNDLFSKNFFMKIPT